MVVPNWTKLWGYHDAPTPKIKDPNYDELEERKQCERSFIHADNLFLSYIQLGST